MTKKMILTLLFVFSVFVPSVADVSDKIVHSGPASGPQSAMSECWALLSHYERAFADYLSAYEAHGWNHSSTQYVFFRASGYAYAFGQCYSVNQN